MIFSTWWAKSNTQLYACFIWPLSLSSFQTDWKRLLWDLCILKSSASPVLYWWTVIVKLKSWNWLLTFWQHFPLSFKEIVLRKKPELPFCISYQEVPVSKLGHISICQIQSLFCRYRPPKKSSSSFGHISIPSSSVFCPFRYLVWRSASRPEGPPLLHELHLHHVLHLWVRAQAHRIRTRGEYSNWQIGVKTWKVEKKKQPTSSTFFVLTAHQTPERNIVFLP